MLGFCWPLSFSDPLSSSQVWGWGLTPVSQFTQQWTPPQGAAQPTAHTLRPENTFPLHCSLLEISLAPLWLPKPRGQCPLGPGSAPVKPKDQGWPKCRSAPQKKPVSELCPAWSSGYPQNLGLLLMKKPRSCSPSSKMNLVKVTSLKR